jgi:hypothetical protein
MQSNCLLPNIDVQPSTNIWARRLRNVIGSASIIALASVGLFLSNNGVANAQAKQLIVRGSYEHINGVNLPWMTNSGGSNYGHDIGPNHYTNYGYDYVSSDVNNYYADIKKMHANIVRVWLFEDLQGLTFGSNGHITGIDPTFMTNLKNMVQLANNNGLALELTINTNSDIAQNGYPAGGGGAVVNWVTNSSAQTDYLNNVIKPLASAFNYNYGVYGYDIMNECNYAVDDGYCSWPQLHSYIYNAAQAIHSINSSIQVTCSTDDLQSFVSANFWNRVGGIGLNYYDYHNYSNSPNLFSLGSNGPYPDINEPIVLAEYGASTTGNWTLQNTVTGDFINQASYLGWAGASAWSYDASGTSGYTLVYGIGNWHSAAWTLQWYSINDFGL